MSAFAAAELQDAAALHRSRLEPVEGSQRGHALDGSLGIESTGVTEFVVSAHEAWKWRVTLLHARGKTGTRIDGSRQRSCGISGATCDAKRARQQASPCRAGQK